MASLLWDYILTTYQVLGDAYEIGWYSGRVLFKTTRENGVFVLYETETLSQPYVRSDIITPANIDYLIPYRVLKPHYQKALDILFQ